VPDGDAASVPLASFMQQNDPEHQPNQCMNRIPVLDVEKRPSLAEYLSFRLVFNPETLIQVTAPDFALKPSIIGRCHRRAAQCLSF
jgi:hypothetical protein